MTLSNQITLVVSSILLVFSSQIKAASIGSLFEADSSFGVNSVTRDITTGLEWLDLGQTSSFSFNSVSLEFGAGGVFDGFAMATRGQVQDLVVNSGMIGLTETAAQTAFDTFSNFLGGPVDDLGGFGCVLAKTGMVNQSGLPDFEGVGIDRTPGVGFDGCGPILPGSEFITIGPIPRGLPIDPNTTINAHNGSSAITIAGIFLVRTFDDPTTVDEPGTIAMLILGLALLGRSIKMQARLPAS